MTNITLLPSAHYFASNTYLISSDGEYAIIDPSVPYSSGLFDGKLKYILLTHAHFDHMLDVDSWVTSTNAPVLVSEYDIAALRDSHKNCYSLLMRQDGGYYGNATPLSDGDTLTLGKEVIRVVSAPGHTPGSLIYTFGNSAFVGDLAFAGGGYGRCDLPGGDYATLCASLEMLCGMDNAMVLYPGHGDAFTVSEFKKYFRIF